jgi:hypothetical protein
MVAAGPLQVATPACGDPWHVAQLKPAAALAYASLPASTASLHPTGPVPDELELLDEEDELLLELDDELELLDEEDEDELLLELDDELLDDEGSPEDDEELLPGVIPPFVQPCRAKRPAAIKIKEIFFIFNDPYKCDPVYIVCCIPDYWIPPPLLRKSRLIIGTTAS